MTVCVLQSCPTTAQRRKCQYSRMMKINVQWLYRQTQNRIIPQSVIYPVLCVPGSVPGCDRGRDQPLTKAVTVTNLLTFQSLRSVKYPDGHAKTPLETIVQEGSTGSGVPYEYQEASLPGRLPMSLESKVRLPPDPSPLPPLRARSLSQTVGSGPDICNYCLFSYNSELWCRRCFFLSFCISSRQGVVYLVVSGPWKMSASLRWLV